MMEISRMRPSVNNKGVVIMTRNINTTIGVTRWSIEPNVRSARPCRRHILVQNDSLDTSLAEDHRQLDLFIQDLYSFRFFNHASVKPAASSAAPAPAPADESSWTAHRSSAVLGGNTTSYRVVVTTPAPSHSNIDIDGRKLRLRRQRVLQGVSIDACRRYGEPDLEPTAMGGCPHSG